MTRTLAELISDENIKVISFDIFDTLLKRPVIFPTDIYFLVEQRARRVFDDILFQFYEMRLDADRRSRSKYQKEDINLDQIYEFMAEENGLSVEVAEQLKSIEIETEKALLRERSYVKEFYKQALACNKRVILVSDMYLTHDTICELLESCGYAGWSKLYVSSEYGKLKGSGSLFKQVLSELKEDGIRPHEILHIGDNLEVDCRVAEKMGMRSFHIPKASDCFWDMDGFRKVWDKELREGDRREFGLRFILGLIANQVFDNPFREDLDSSSYYGGKLGLFGYYLVGPLLLFFSKWVLEESLKGGYDKLVFLARDGYRPYQYYMKLAGLYENTPAADYVLNSRASMLPATIRSRHDIMSQGKAHNVHADTSLRYFLENRLLLPISPDVEKFFVSNGYKSLDDKVGDVKRVAKLALHFEERILSKCRTETSVICDYYKPFFDAGKTAIVDIGYRGTMQAQLGVAMGRSVDAFFFYAFNEALQMTEQGYRVFPYIEANNVCNATPWYNVAQFMEIGFCSLEPSLLKFEKNDESIEPMYDDEGLPKRTLEVYQSIHEGADTFLEDALAWLGEYLIDLRVSNDTLLAPLLQLLKHPQYSDTTPFLGVEFEDKLQCGSGDQPRLLAQKDFKGPVLWDAGNRVFNKAHEIESRLSVRQDKMNAFLEALQPYDSEPLLSVIIPVYNTEAFLPAAFNYLYAQQYENLEIIVVDDGSPGNCKEITERRQKLDPRVRYIAHESNRGLFVARLTGIKAAKGEYIAHYDPDDQLMPSFYQKMIERAVVTGADVVHCDVLQINKEGGMWIEPHNKIDYHYLEGRDIFDSFFTDSLHKSGTLRWHWHVVWNKIYRKSLLVNIEELWDIDEHILMHEDFLSSTLVLYNAKKMVAVQEPLIFYYRHSESASLNHNNHKKMLGIIRSNGRVFGRAHGFLSTKPDFQRYKPYLDVWIETHAKHNRNYVIQNRRKARGFNLSEAFNEAYGQFGFTV